MALRPKPLSPVRSHRSAIRRRLPLCARWWTKPGPPLLPSRAKALTFAIVGKALGCEQSQLEARRLLAGEGLGPAEASEILANLSSPLLDPVEASLVTFARETVWYQPAQIQRKARHLSDAIGQARFLEAAGLAALANAVCRLGAVLASPR